MKYLRIYCSILVVATSAMLMASTDMNPKNTMDGLPVTAFRAEEYVIPDNHTIDYHVDYANEALPVTAQDPVIIAVNRNTTVWRGEHFPSVYFFPIDRDQLNRDYRNNFIMLEALDEALANDRLLANIDTLEIIGAGSPIASEEYNRRLALSRCHALRSYILSKRPDIDGVIPFHLNVIGIDHLGYSTLTQHSPALTEKEKWDMLQYAAVRLKMKDGSYIIPGSDRPKTPVAAATKDTNVYVYLRDTVYLTYIMDCLDYPQKAPKKPIYMALKTNLLYDAVLLPNLTAEFWLGSRLSLAIEGNWSWWTRNDPIQNWWYHRIQAAGAELRYWMKSPHPLNGHAVGVYYIFGDYDIRLSTKDEYSKGWLSYGSRSAGVTYAYSMPIARKFNLEFGLGLGFLGGRYYQYDYCMQHEEWTQRAVYNRKYFGPTRVGVSIVWLPFTGNKKKEDRWNVTNTYY
jgi:hypothetical protein